MKFLPSAILTFALLLSAGCFGPYRYARITGDIVFQAKDHKLYLSAESLRRNDQNKWTKGFRRPSDKPVPDTEDAVGFRLWPSYGNAPGDPHPTSFVITSMEVWLDGKQVDFVPLAVVQEDWNPLEEFRVPADADFSRKQAPNLKSGTYLLKVHYLLDGRDYDARWELVYGHGLGFEPWRRADR